MFRRPDKVNEATDPRDPLFVTGWPSARPSFSMRYVEFSLTSSDGLSRQDFGGHFGESRSGPRGGADSVSEFEAPRFGK